MKLILFFLIFSQSVNAQFSGHLDIKPEMLKFIYQPTEDTASNCTHEIENEMSGDWVVKCPYYSKVKEFSVHLLIRRAVRTRKPSTWYEVLYWVTNRIPGQSRREFTGTTLNFYTEDPSTLSGFTLGQHVDNSYADLKMTFKPTLNHKLPE